jgi:hypothetical protein
VNRAHIVPFANRKKGLEKMENNMFGSNLELKSIISPLWGIVPLVLIYKNNREQV